MEVLLDHRCTQASDDRDGIFAFCGLVNQADLNGSTYQHNHRREGSEAYKHCTRDVRNPTKNALSLIRYGSQLISADLEGFPIVVRISGSVFIRT